MGTTVSRVMENLPGPGWYWEVIAESTTVVARGLADTRAQAETQATEAERMRSSFATPLREIAR